MNILLNKEQTMVRELGKDLVYKNYKFMSIKIRKRMGVKTRWMYIYHKQNLVAWQEFWHDSFKNFYI